MQQPKLTLESLLNNEDFIVWVRHPTPRREQYWQQYLQRHPEHTSVVAQAREVLRALQSDEDKLTAFEKQLLQHRLEQRIAESSGGEHSISEHSMSEHVIGGPSRLRARHRYSYGLAASVAVFLLLLGGVIWMNQDQTQVWSTGYGETASLKLPDGSTVVLNANSQLRYAKNWQDREVWLEGEAYFHVQEHIDPLTADSAKFTVHTDNLTVMVLGTRFNVNSRQAQVVLDDGKVNVRQNDLDSVEMDLRPGEMVVLDRKMAQLIKREVNPYQYIAWKDNMLILDETPLAEIARLLKDRYGYTVTFETASLEEVLFMGTYPADDIEVLLRTLERSLNVEINGKEILIKE